MILYDSTMGTITGTGTISYASAASLVYNGTAALTATDKEFPSSNGPFNLILNNSGNVTLHSNKTISGTLRFLNGKLITGACNAGTSNTALTLADNATVSGANSSRFVDGILKKTGDDAFTFPVGSGSNYAPVGISAPSANTDRFAACYVGSNPNSSYSITSKAGSLNNLSKTEYWHINRENGTSAANVTLSWDARSGGIADLGHLRVCRWNGTQWADESNTGTTGNTSVGTVTSGSISSFRPFTLGSTSSANPLPVELIYFKAKCLDKKKMLYWATASEKNNSHFIIAKSADAHIWTDIGRIEGQGTTAMNTNYEHEDVSTIEGSYYRLFQQDYEGEGEYFKVIYLPIKGCEEEFQLYFDYENRCLRWQGISTSSDLDIQIRNQMGQNVYIPDTPNLSYLRPGIYVLTAAYQGHTITEKIQIKQ